MISPSGDELGLEAMRRCKYLGLVNDKLSGFEPPKIPFAETVDRSKSLYISV